MEKQEFNKVELDDERNSLINLFEEKNKNFNKEEFVKEMNEDVQKKITNNEIDKVDLLMFIQAHSNRIERAIDDFGIIPYSFFYVLKSYIDAFYNLHMKEMHDNENKNACEWKIIDNGKPMWNISIFTGCGKRYIPHGLSQNNPFDFCPYCGKKIINKNEEGDNER